MSKEQNNYQDKQIERLDIKIDDVQACLDDFRQNHFHALQSAVDMLKTDVSWLKKFFFIIATASVGGLVAGILNLILK